uniref:Si:ch73-71c20.5 n=1 Tax=Sphaeramia orbicularis TaxID=375764 RepID=A0A673AR35_9TELE
PQVMCQFLRLQAARCRPLHVSPASMCVSRTESQKSTQPPNPAGTGSQTQDKTNKAEEEEEEEEGPEYIPRTKAKNPMRKIGYAWMIGLPSGIIGFLLAKRQVDKNRLKQLKIRQRMKQSNEGEYEGSRYLHHHHKESVKVDQS